MRTTVEDSALVSYGLLAGGARVFVPPVFDLPFVRAVRGAMFDRLARVGGATLTVEARRTLADLDESATTRGVAQQALRWVAGRFLPGAPVLDAVRNVLRTYAAGVLFRRYLQTHRPTPHDPVVNASEAAHVRRALRTAIEVASIDHLRKMGEMALLEVREAPPTREVSVVQHYADAVVTAIADLPESWLDVLDGDFVKALRQS